MNQLLGPLADLGEELGSVPSTHPHGESQPCVNSRMQCPLLGFTGTRYAYEPLVRAAHHRYVGGTHAHIRITLIQIKYNSIILFKKAYNQGAVKWLPN